MGDGCQCLSSVKLLAARGHFLFKTNVYHAIYVYYFFFNGSFWMMDATVGIYHTDMFNVYLVNAHHTSDVSISSSVYVVYVIQLHFSFSK